MDRISRHMTTLMKIGLAIGCLALVVLWPEWRVALQGEGYPAGHPCNTSDECRIFLICENRVCGLPLLKECMFDSECPPEFICSTGTELNLCVPGCKNENCPHGMRCTAGTPPFCASPSDPPVCMDTSDCPADRICESGQCVLRPGPPQPGPDPEPPQPGPGPEPPQQPKIFRVSAGNVPALIAAINEANTTPVEDTIILGVGSVPYTLRDTLPSITSPIIIKAPQTVTIQRDATTLLRFRILHIARTGTLTLDRLTITGGFVRDQDGGGIFNEGMLTLTNSTVTDNKIEFDGGGGGIFNRGTLILKNSTVSKNIADFNGGGIDNAGTLILENSTVSKNMANADGGGIRNSHRAALVNSTITGNTTNDVGGGISNIVIGTLTSRNVTITQNIASKGASGFSNNGTANISHTIIAQNNMDRDCEGNFNSEGFNLIGSNQGCNGFVDNVKGDQVGTSNSPIDALLGDLGKNGGLTETHALLSSRSLVANPSAGNSPAIDQGNGNVCASSDQRGFPRPIDGDRILPANCDIGAFEFGPQIIPGQINGDQLLTFVEKRPIPRAKPATTNCPGGVFEFSAILTNTSNNPRNISIRNKTFSQLVVEVQTLTNGNLLQNADGGPGGVGARRTLSSIERLAPGGAFNVDFAICLRTRVQFELRVFVLGMVED